MDRDDYIENMEDMFSDTLMSFVSGVTECSVYCGNVQLVDEAALDRFILLSNKVLSSICLAEKYIKVEKISEEIEQELLLSWLTLGAVTEYALAIFLAVYPKQTIKHIPKVQKITHRKIEDLTFCELIKFYQKVAGLPGTDIDMLFNIKNNRNAVHLIKYKELSTWEAYKFSVEYFFSLLQNLIKCLPDLDDSKEYCIQAQREIESMYR